jgi:hypothetical protein
MQKIDTLESFIEYHFSHSEDYGHELWLNYCKDNGYTLKIFCNTFALSTAKKFQTGIVGFDICDDAINILFTFMCNHLLLQDDDVEACSYKLEELPEPAFSIYLAFDRGEYRASYDRADDIPFEKYTRPEIEKILTEWEAS